MSDDPRDPSDPRNPDDQQPMMELTPELAAAIALWEHLAAFAWEQNLTLGRGVVVVDRAGLLEAQQQQSAGEPVQMRLAYVPMLEVPSGDDFLQIIAKYDVTRQIVVLVGDPGPDEPDDDEQLFVIEAGEGRRPLPADCYFAQHP